MSQPGPLRTAGRLLLRAARDLATGTLPRLARPSEARRKERRELVQRIVEHQPIRHTEQWANKVHNLRLAAERIEGVAVEPGEVFSFWAMVGAPTSARGFRDSRTIVSGSLRSSPGGGLCQLSGMLYTLALRAGLCICERHPHSIDIYNDATRFAPLGSDATVVYGRKDVRFSNTLEGTMCFSFQVTEDALTVALRTSRPFVEHRIEHRTARSTPELAFVETLRLEPGGTKRRLCCSRYVRRPDAGQGSIAG